jgi:hypothetical protein
MPVCWKRRICHGMVFQGATLSPIPMLLLFSDDIKSEGELMRIIPERLDYLWFLGYGLDDQIPDHSVLIKARKRWGKEVFISLFSRVVEQCVEAGLVEGARSMSTPAWWKPMRACARSSRLIQSWLKPSSKPRGSGSKSSMNRTTTKTRLWRAAAVADQPSGNTPRPIANFAARPIRMRPWSARGTCLLGHLRPYCTRSRTGRTIHRHRDQTRLEKARKIAKSNAAKRDLRRRQHLMERSFADATNCHGLKRARWRGLWRQAIQICSLPPCRT